MRDRVKTAPSSPADMNTTHAARLACESLWRLRDDSLYVSDSLISEFTDFLMRP